MAVACLALLIALGGTSIAAVSALAPGSVNTAALQNGAVTARKLADKAVTLAKLAPSARIPGSKGDPGPKGDPGLKGDKGDVGPSDAYLTTQASVKLETTLALVTGVTIPQAGNYVVWAKTWLLPSQANPVTGQIQVDCQLFAAGVKLDESVVTIPGLGPEMIALNLAHAYSAPGTAALSCDSNWPGVTAENTVVSAIRVGRLTSS